MSTFIAPVTFSDDCTWEIAFMKENVEIKLKEHGGEWEEYDSSYPPNDPRYEYKIFRREKKKEMPDLRIGDSITIEKYNGEIDIILTCISGDGYSHVAHSLDGSAHYVDTPQILKIRRDGKRIK